MEGILSSCYLSALRSACLSTNHMNSRLRPLWRGPWLPSGRKIAVLSVEFAENLPSRTF